MPTDNAPGAGAVLFFLLMLLAPLLMLLWGLLVFFCGWFLGHRHEQDHRRDLDRREAAAAGVLVTSLKTFPGACPGAAQPQLVTGEVVIGSDTMKNWLARWQGFFGGEMKGYASMQSRARREARLRVIEQALAAGHNAVGNLRLEGADILGATHAPRGKRRAAAVAVLASGTAYTWKPD